MKRYSMVLFLFVFLFSFSVGVFGESIYSIDTLNNTSIKVSSLEISSKIKVMIEKDGEKYYYNLNNTEEYMPLQLGKGTYTVKILENISGKKYRVVEKKDIKIKEEDTEKLYLGSNQPVYWTSQKDTIELGKNITKGLTSEQDKVNAVYNYIVKNIEYDHDKMDTIDDNYVPELDLVLSTGEGICYDYSSLFAGILRSQGIPTKLVKGYKSDLEAYHAWNEVFVDGEWITIDTTYDAAFKDSRKEVRMIKSKDGYTNVRVY